MLTPYTNYSNDSTLHFHMFVPKSFLLEEKLDSNFEVWKFTLKFLKKILRGPKADAYFKPVKPLRWKVSRK